MKHKKIASALIAAIIIFTSASNSIFPVSARDLDVQNQEQSEASVDEINESLDETDMIEETTEQIESTESVLSENETASTEITDTEITEQETEEVITPDTEEADNKDNEETKDDTVDVDTEIPSETEDSTEESTEITIKGAEAEYFDRSSWQSSESISTFANTDDDLNVTASIRKRAEWINESNGDGQITLEYKATMGSKTALKDMNIVLIQDKSGSMDSNYGYNLECVRKGWSVTPKSKYYPIRSYGPDNETPWTEPISWLRTQNNNNYFAWLNANLTNYTGFWNNSYGNYLYNGEMYYNSPCQLENHYYLLVKDDNTSGYKAWTMVSGRNLYNINNTDLHHYIRVSDQEYRNYLNKDMRVVRLDNGDRYCDESGVVKQATASMYFVDVTHIDSYDNGQTWILNTCGEADCQKNSRLAKSQEFMKNIVNYIVEMNPDNKIAYVPFWGDVPDNGKWSNASGNSNNTDIVDDNNGRLQQYDGVTKLNFTTSFDTIKEQIDNPFTYDGTNWTRAFRSAYQYITNQNSENETLVIFLTDGMPQGTAGKVATDNNDYGNPAINGGTELENLKKLEKSGVTIYACGVGVNAADQTDLATRLNSIDSSGEAVYARTTDEFSALEETILDRINTKYSVTVKGENAFYTDVLDENFTLDLDKINQNEWEILDKAEGSPQYNVPGNVYEAAKYKNKKYIYIKEMNTVYWYIGEMTEGGYETTAHKMTFPMKYKHYDTVTSGDIKMKSNNDQKLTYTTTLGRSGTETMTPPQLIFNRQPKPYIEIVKTVTGAEFTEAQTFRFAYSKCEYQSGKVVDVLGTTTVNVGKNASTGTGRFENLEPGTYYVYEVDKNNNMISPTVCEVTVTEDAKITTEEKSSEVPASATASDVENLTNLNNVLRITTIGGTVGFTNEYVKVNVTKNWDNEGGNTSFRPDKITVHLLRNGQEIKSMDLSEDNQWTGSFTNLEKKDPTGTAYAYSVTEDEVSGYETTVSAMTATSDSEYSYTITNTLLRGSITIHKKDGDGRNLQGVTFELKNSNEEIVDTKTSDTNGEVKFTDLLPGDYTVTETKTTSGNMLLKDPIKVTIPMKLTEEEADAQNVDTSNCKEFTENGTKFYWIYDFTYEITNGTSFEVPAAGGSETVWTYVPLIAGMLLLFAVAVILLHKKKNHMEV